MSTQRIVYIAGPMTGLPEWNFPEFDRVAEELREQGHTVVNPCDFDRERGFNPKTATEFSNEQIREAMVMEFAGCKRLDEEYSLGGLVFNSPTWLGLADCTDLVLLDGWENSKGAFAEASVALWLGITVWLNKKPLLRDPVFSQDHLINLRRWLREQDTRCLTETSEKPSVLQEAQEIVEQRENQHGTFEDCLEDISKVWSTLLGNAVTGSDVARCMAALKLVRGKQPEYNRDNPLDLCGYAEGWSRWEETYGRTKDAE